MAKTRRWFRSPSVTGFVAVVVLACLQVGSSPSAWAFAGNVSWPDGRTIAVEVEGADTVLSVKQKLRDKTCVSTDQFDLSVAGKILEDVRTLQDYNVTASTVMAVSFVGDPMVPTVTCLDTSMSTASGSASAFVASYRTAWRANATSAAALTTAQFTWSSSAPAAVPTSGSVIVSADAAGKVGAELGRLSWTSSSGTIVTYGGSVRVPAGDFWVAVTNDQGPSSGYLRETAALSSSGPWALSQSADNAFVWSDSTDYSSGKYLTSRWPLVRLQDAVGSTLLDSTGSTPIENTSLPVGSYYTAFQATSQSTTRITQGSIGWRTSLGGPPAAGDLIVLADASGSMGDEIGRLHWASRNASTGLATYTGSVTIPAGAFWLRLTNPDVNPAQSLAIASPLSSAGPWGFELAHDVYMWSSAIDPGRYIAFGAAPLATLSIASPTTVAVKAGDNQQAAPGAAVATRPSVLVTDAAGNPVANALVTFTVATGGGSLAASGGVRSNTSGIATSPSWTLGQAAGTNTLTATIGTLTGSPVTFTARATVTSGSTFNGSVEPTPTTNPTANPTANPAPVIPAMTSVVTPLPPRNPITAETVASGITLVGSTVATRTPIRTMTHPLSSELKSAPIVTARVGSPVQLAVHGLAASAKVTVLININGAYHPMRVIVTDPNGRALLPAFAVRKPGRYRVAVIDQASDTVAYLKLVLDKHRQAA